MWIYKITNIQNNKVIGLDIIIASKKDIMKLTHYVNVEEILIKVNLKKKWK